LSKCPEATPDTQAFDSWCLIDDDGIALVVRTAIGEERLKSGGDFGLGVHISLPFLGFFFALCLAAVLELDLDVATASCSPESIARSSELAQALRAAIARLWIATLGL
jgi:hypothetical protein